MKRPIDKDTLFEFFDGKTTSIQRKMIEEWLLRPENSERYYQYLDEWESQRTQFMPDESAALERYRGIMANREAKTEPRTGLRSGWFGKRWLWLSGIAACGLIISVFAGRDILLYERYENLYGTTARHTLSDGTTVTLNANSRLWAPRFGFGEDTRQVWLEGEAEFQVTHTTNSSRFVVMMDEGYFIEVLGTRFVAFSREKNKRVYLTEGKVKLILPEGRQLYMKPGNLFEADEEKAGVISTPGEPQQYLAWTTHQFYFNNTPLTEVTRQMEERFGVRIRIMDPELEKKELGGVYEAQSPDDLLQILSELFGIRISRNKNRIELRVETNF